MSLLVKHAYKVKIHWLEHDVEYRDVIAISGFHAVQKVVEGSDKGMYDAENSTAVVYKYNVAVQRDAKKDNSVIDVK